MNTRELGRWRKLWTRPSATWELLPLSARGLGDELLRVCDEQGRVTRPKSMKAHEVCVRLLRAHPSEARRVKADLEALVADGFVVVTDDAITVRNFVEAQQGVTESGERMREMRARDAGARVPPAGKPAPSAGESVPPVGGRVPSAGDGDNPSKPLDRPRHGDASESREEKKSGEESPERAGAREAAPPPGSSTPDPGASGVFCSTVERVVPEGRAAENQAMLAALQRGGGGAVRTAAPNDVTLRFLGACREAGFDAKALETLGEYLRSERDAARGAFPWTHGRRSIDLPFLNHDGAARLTEFVGKALDWRATRRPQPAPPPPTKRPVPERPFVPATPASLDAHRRKAGLPSLLADAEPQETARVA